MAGLVGDGDCFDEELQQDGYVPDGLANRGIMRCDEFDRDPLGLLRGSDNK